MLGMHLQQRRSYAAHFGKLHPQRWYAQRRGGLRAGQWRGLDVAIKTVLFDSGPEAAELSKVASEAAIASNLHHDNVVITYAHDICKVESPLHGNELAMFKFYLIQEYCNGRSLRDALQRGYFTAEQMAQRWQPTMAVLRGVAGGMSYIHSKRICHGDLNPANVLFKVCCPMPCMPCMSCMPRNCALCALMVLVRNLMHAQVRMAVMQSSALLLPAHMHVCAPDWATRSISRHLCAHWCVSRSHCMRGQGRIC